MAARTPKFLTLRLLLAGLILSAGLAGAVVMHVMAVKGGSEIILAAQAFDPRALLTGNYAQVTYAISRPHLEAHVFAPAPNGVPSGSRLCRTKATGRSPA